MTLKNKKTYFFLDFDGTLMDTIGTMWTAYKDFTVKLGISPSEEEFKYLNGPSIFEACTYFQKKYKTKQDTQELYTLYLQIIDQYYQASKPLDGAHELLDQLSKSSAKSLLVTSNTKNNVFPLLEKYKWESYFSSFLFGDQVEQSKPNPAIYLKAFEISKAAKKENILVIEDSINGVKSAFDAGIEVIGLEGTFDKDILIKSGAHKVFSSLKEVSNYLLNVS